jgi:DNA-binding NarL/FixJ family response regulator
MKYRSKIRVFLADDHPLFRAGLRLSLNAASDIEVVDEAGNSFDAVEKIKKHPPDVVLMDVDMPGLSGIAAIRMLHTALPDLKVVVLSSYNDTDYVNEAMRAGAIGYILKNVSIDELEQIIKSIHAGQTVVSPYLLNLSVEVTPPQNSLQTGLTTREKEVLKCIAQGKGNKDIARELFVSLETVKSHIRNIYKKLDVKNRIEASRAAFRLGLTEP